MYVLVVALCLLTEPAQSGPPQRALSTAPAERAGAAQAEPVAGTLEYVRRQYRDDAEQYAFHADAERQHSLKPLEKPVLRWASDDDWSGDVLVWMHEGQPGVIGCILSGPGGERNRNVYHEFHLLAERPIAPVGLQTGRNWEPEGGLARNPLPDAPPPADSAAGRLVQMRQISRSFTAHMDADGHWELRLLPQPLLRYGDENTAKSGIVDGALFAWVWTKGTDPELIVLLECRRAENGLAWQYAPVRFSNRPLWLKHGDNEVWRVDTHREPTGGTTSLIYSTAYARTIAREAPAPE